MFVGSQLWSAKERHDLAFYSVMIIYILIILHYQNK